MSRPRIYRGTLQMGGSLAVDISATDHDFEAPITGRRVAMLVAGGSGALVVRGSLDTQDQTISAAQLAAMGGVLQMQVSKVIKTGTTATDIRAFYY